VGGLFYSILTASITHNGKHDTTMEREFHDYVRNTPGALVAFGTEYPLSSNFAVGGEFGLRGVLIDEGAGSGSARTDNWLSWGSTFASLSLNFYY
jgi:hypothetical protein